MDVKDAARIIGVSEPRVYQLIREEKLKAIDVGQNPKNARWDIDEDSMRKLIKDRDIEKAARDSVKAVKKTSSV